MTDTPPATVVIATYNRAEYIGAAIESVLSQTVPGVEVIVVDDGSTDHTRRVVEGFGSVVRYVYQDNAERAAARNRGLSLARASLVSFLDSDDMLFPHAIEAELEGFEHDRSAVLVYGDVVFMNADGVPNGRMRRPTHRGFVLDKIVRRNFVGLGANMLRKEVFEHIGGFREERRLSGSEDWEAWVRLAARGPFVHLRRPTLLYRVHSGSTVGDPSSMERSMLCARDLIFSNPELRDRIALHRPHAYAYVHLTLSNLFRAAGDRANAWRHLGEARRSRPLSLLTRHYWSVCGRLLAGRRLVGHAARLKRWATRVLDDRIA